MISLVEQSTKMIPKSNSAAIQQAKTNKEVFSLYEKENTDSEEVNEKSVSKQQQKLMGLALSVKKGDTPKSKVSKKVEKMAKEMSKKELEDFASTKHKGLPKKKETDEDVKKLEESILNILENHLPPHTTKGELLEVIRRRK